MANYVEFNSISVNSSRQVKVKYNLPNPSSYIPGILGDSGVWRSVTITYGLKSTEEAQWAANVITGFEWPKENTFSFTAPTTGDYGIKIDATIGTESSVITISIPTVYDDFTVGTLQKFILKVGEATGNSWVDFTDCLVAPNYKVNRLPVSEEWEDANWVKHYVSPRKRIQGTFEMLFTTKERYYYFLDLLRKNEEYEDTITMPGGDTFKRKRGPGIVKLKLQVNNELDDFSSDDYQNKVPKVYIGYFKIVYEPTWFIPFIGIKEYDALEVEIEEA